MNTLMMEEVKRAEQMSQNKRVQAMKTLVSEYVGILKILSLQKKILINFGHYFFFQRFFLGKQNAIPC